MMTEAAMIYFFAYFWTTVQFQPKEMANQLRDYGSFIPGLRPGKRTGDYLEKVMMRITYVGAAFLCVIAVVPTAIVTASLGIDPQITAFLGGTGLAHRGQRRPDMVQRIEANLLMRNYGGFLGGGRQGQADQGKTVLNANVRCKLREYRFDYARLHALALWHSYCNSMPIIIKSRFEIERMRRAGQLGCEILAKMRRPPRRASPRRSWMNLARAELDKAGGSGAVAKIIPPIKPAKAFPAIPASASTRKSFTASPVTRTLKEGDVVTLDLALSLDGYCADTATTVGVGEDQPGAAAAAGCDQAKRSTWR